MSYQWVVKYLPDRFKDCQQSERARLALRHRAEIGELLGPRARRLVDPPRDILRIRAYGNTNLVNIMVKKKLYNQLEKKAKKLQVTMDKLIYNAMLMILKT